MDTLAKHNSKNFFTFLSSEIWFHSKIISNSKILLRKNDIFLHLITRKNKYIKAPSKKIYIKVNINFRN